MRGILIILLFIASVLVLHGQTVKERISGKVSFVTSQNVYVKFRSTAGISAGDTLYILSDERPDPVLKVINLSSVSCVCTPVSDIVLPVDHLIVAFIKAGNSENVVKEVQPVIQEIFLPEIRADSVQSGPSVTKQKQKICGSISAVSYSDFSNTGRANSQRFHYTFSLNAPAISNSKISFESYISFRHKSGEWTDVKSNLFNALKIYNLAFRYDLNESTIILFGRRVNPKISSIGAVDGIQFEKSYKGFTLGALAGTRPDYTDYGVDFNLFQYGGFLAFRSNGTGTFTESSIAFMQQMNKSITDRRFLYFQHSNSLLKNIYFLSSFEIDLYKLENDLPKSTFELTGTYITLRYNITKKFTLSGSYDARKNVIYYETFKTFNDRILGNEIRQGLRLNASWRTQKNIMFGLQSGYRFLKGDPHATRNIYGYLTHTRIPGLNISATLSGTLLESAWMNGRIAGFNMSRAFAGGKVQTGLGYHFVDYRIPENQLDIIQHTGEANLYWQFIETLTLSVNYEVSFEQKDTYNRIYLQIRKRF
jgi:hypothetical protein